MQRAKQTLLTTKVYEYSRFILNITNIFDHFLIKITNIFDHFGITYATGFYLISFGAGLNGNDAQHQGKISNGESHGAKHMTRISWKVVSVIYK